MTGSVRALFIIPSLMRAGAETQVLELMNGISSDSFVKHLCCFEERLDLLTRLNTKEVQFHHYIRRRKFDIATIKNIAKLIDEHSIDVLHCSLQIALFYGILARQFSVRKPPVVLAVHTTTNRNKRADVFDIILYQWLMRCCKKIIFVCDAQKRYWCSRFAFISKRAIRIYNGININAFDSEDFVTAGLQLRQQLAIPNSGCVFGCIAAMRPEKGHLTLIDAFSRISATKENAFLLLAGDGALRGNIEAEVKKRSLESKVIFLGNVSDVRPVLSAIDCSVLASTAVETFSIAMLESLAMGVPVIATAIGGAAEAITPGRTGLLINPGDPLELAAAMDKMMSAIEIRESMGASAALMVRENFSATQMISQTEELLHAIAQNGPR